MRSSTRSLVLASAACIAFAATSASAADPAFNILFYGNSYTTPGDSSAGITPYTVPYLVKGITQASGRTAPNVENASVYGADLAGHIQLRTGFISNPVDFVESPGFQWNHVVMQEMSTKPTNITYGTPDMGNPTAFKNDANTLYGLVKDHSPNARAVLYQTWAESPKSTTDLNNYYPAPPTYFAKANQMSAELHQYYGEARTLLGASTTSVAPVGDAFKNSNYDDKLYQYGFGGTGDWRHPSPKGTLLAGLVIFDTIYQTDARLISYTQMNTTLTNIDPTHPLSYYGINNSSDWSTLTNLAYSSVPEPTSLGLVLLLSTGLLARRRK